MPPIYHYCGLNTLLGIFASSSPVFHLSNIFFMNDHMEVGWFKKVCGDVVNSLYGHEATKLELIFRKKLRERLAVLEFDDIYCGSFSKLADDLSQWRGYADDAQGICLGVDRESLDKSNETCQSVSIKDVIYDKSKQETIAREMISTLSKGMLDGIGDVMGIMAIVEAFIRGTASQFKNPAFKAEDEVRVVATCSMSGSAIDTTKSDSNRTADLPSGVKFKERNGRLLPYVEIDFPEAVVREVWLGPKYGGAMDKAAMQRYLSARGIKAEVKVSEASFR